MSTINDIIKHLHERTHSIKFIQDTLIADLGMTLSYKAIKYRIRKIRLFPISVPKQIAHTTVVSIWI